MREMSAQVTKQRATSRGASLFVPTTLCPTLLQGKTEKKKKKTEEKNPAGLACTLKARKAFTSPPRLMPGPPWAS